MRLCEEYKIVNLLEPENHQAAALGPDSINMKNYQHVCFIILFGELTGDEILYLYEGATDAAETAAVTFNYRATAIDLKTASGDVLGTESTSAALTLTAATYEDRMLIIEVDADEMTDGYDWLTLKGDGSATELFASVVAILTPKYKGADLHTAIS